MFYIIFVISLFLAILFGLYLSLHVDEPLGHE